MFRKLLLALAIIALIAGCTHVITPVSAQSVGPGVVSVTWTAPTQNTDGSPITGTLSYTVYEMAPCQTATTCASDQQNIGTVASAVTATSAQISNVPDGLHCYTVQTNEVLPDGANVSSALAPLQFMTDGTGSCTIMTGSATPQQTPSPAQKVKVT